MACPSLSSTPGAPRQKKTHEPSRAWEISRALLAVFSFNIRAPGPWTFTESKARGLRLTGLPLVGGRVGTGAGWTLRRGFPPVPGRGRGGVLRTLWVVGAFPVPRGAAPRGAADSGGGAPFLPRNGGKRAGGKPPGPPFLWPARSHSLVLAWWGAAGRWLGCFVAHVRALIWIRILREQGSRKNELRCGGVAPTKASPWGEAVTEGDG